MSTFMAVRQKRSVEAIKSFEFAEGIVFDRSRADDLVWECAMPSAKMSAEFEVRLDSVAASEFGSKGDPGHVNAKFVVEFQGVESARVKGVSCTLDTVFIEKSTGMLPAEALLHLNDPERVW